MVSSPAQGSEYVRCTRKTPARVLGIQVCLLHVARWNRKVHMLITHNIHEWTRHLQNQPPLKNSLSAQQPNRGPNPPLTSSLLVIRNILFVFSSHCQIYENIKSWVWKKVRVHEVPGSDTEGWLVAWQSGGHTGSGKGLTERCEHNHFCRSKFLLEIMSVSSKIKDADKTRISLHKHLEMTEEINKQTRFKMQSWTCIKDRGYYW